LFLGYVNGGERKEMIKTTKRGWDP
jgi:hypothetical protein